MAGPQSTPEAPWPVRRLNAEVKGWIQRLGSAWVEGQLTQVNVKPTWKLSYLTLRDTESETSVQLTAPTNMVQSMASPLRDGDRVVVNGRPAFYEGGAASPCGSRRSATSASVNSSPALNACARSWPRKVSSTRRAKSVCPTSRRASG